LPEGKSFRSRDPVCSTQPPTMSRPSTSGSEGRTNRRSCERFRAQGGWGSLGTDIREKYFSPLSSPEEPGSTGREGRARPDLSRWGVWPEAYMRDGGEADATDWPARGPISNPREPDELGVPAAVKARLFALADERRDPTQVAEWLRGEALSIILAAEMDLYADWDTSVVCRDHYVLLWRVYSRALGLMANELVEEGAFRKEFWIPLRKNGRYLSRQYATLQDVAGTGGVPRSAPGHQRSQGSGERDNPAAGAGGGTGSLAGGGARASDLQPEMRWGGGQAGRDEGVEGGGQLQRGGPGPEQDRGAEVGTRAGIHMTPCGLASGRPRWPPSMSW
jgi:hypothetical protein